MGPSGLAAGILIALAGLVLLALALSGMALLVLGALANQRRGSRPLVWTGASLLALVAVAVVATLVWVRFSSDPDTLELDLREPISAASLDKEEMPGFPGVYDYSSDRVALVLPDGTHFASDADAVTVWTEDGTVTSVRINRQMMSRTAATTVVQDWAGDLGLGSPDPGSSGAWSVSEPAGGAEARLSLQPGTDGGARPFLAIEVSSTAAAP
ncbi:hypothetical protein [Mumia sp. DW29H23]|uniref:hypothetical protein n=1 Tax=Mumia sp. DW29H23 TaxID=3421241 RepID=UPI003D69FDE6